MTTDDAIPSFAEIVTDRDESGHTSARMTARPRRIEVITGPDRRRRWSLEQKQAIVAESYRANTSPAAVARRHGLNTGQLYTWRHLLAPVPVPAFACVGRAGETSGAEPAARRAGLIEIVLPGGIVVRVDTNVSETSLRRVLSAIRG